MLYISGQTNKTKMKFVILLLCLIAHFVIMLDKERTVVAVKMTSEVNYQLLSAKFTNYGVTGKNRRYENLSKNLLIISLL